VAAPHWNGAGERCDMARAIEKFEIAPEQQDRIMPRPIAERE
jgi:hypothetical protein